MEIAIREQIGAVVSPNALEEVPVLIRELLSDKDELKHKMELARDKYLFNFGHSVDAAVKAIIDLSDRLAKEREAMERGARG